MSKILSDKIKVIAIVGATASGKTSYSIELAKKINGEIISADSRLVYKGFDIGTAKPTIEEMDNIPHHLIDIIEPNETYSAGLYQNDATAKIYEIAARNKTPIIVGGTGLYLNVLLNNYDMPKIAPNMLLRSELEKYSTLQLVDILIKKNGLFPSTIDVNDRKKIIRAIEIVTTTGKSLDETQKKANSNFEVEWIGRNYVRSELYERINKRVDIMLEQGLVTETKKLLEKYGKIPNIVDTIGYKEIIGYLDGLYSLEEAAQKLKQNTRNYAKRQMTWFRKNPEIKWNVYPEKLKK